MHDWITDGFTAHIPINIQSLRSIVQIQQFLIVIENKKKHRNHSVPTKILSFAHIIQWICTSLLYDWTPYWQNFFFPLCDATKHVYYIASRQLRSRHCKARSCDVVAISRFHEFRITCYRRLLCVALSFFPMYIYILTFVRGKEVFTFEKYLVLYEFDAVAVWSLRAKDLNSLNLYINMVE